MDISRSCTRHVPLTASPHRPRRRGEAQTPVRCVCARVAWRARLASPGGPDVRCGPLRQSGRSRLPEALLEH